MNDLIEALNIFAKYSDTKFPTHCTHDVLYVMVSPDKVSEEDQAKLDKLGFFPDKEYGECFMSYKFGSA